MIGRISGQYNIDSANRKKSKPNVNYGNYSENSSDEAKFSSVAVQLAKITSELKNISDVRNDVVEKFKTQIEDGSYNPPLGGVADKLISAGFLDLE